MLDSPSMALIDAAKDALRTHFREREAERSRQKITEWQEQKIYPYVGNVSSPIERNERQVFDVVALNLADYSSEFEKASPRTQKLIFQLVKTAVETGPSALPGILQEVIGLPAEKQKAISHTFIPLNLSCSCFIRHPHFINDQSLRQTP